MKAGTGLCLGLLALGTLSLVRCDRQAAPAAARLPRPTMPATPLDPWTWHFVGGLLVIQGELDQPTELKLKGRTLSETWLAPAGPIRWELYRPPPGETAELRSGEGTLLAAWDFDAPPPVAKTQHAARTPGTQTGPAQPPKPVAPPPAAKVEPPKPQPLPPPPARIVPPGPWARTEPHLQLPRTRPTPPPPVAKAEPPKPAPPPPAAKVEPPKPLPPPPPPARIVPPGPWARTEPHLPLLRTRPTPPPPVAKVEPPKPAPPPPAAKVEPPKPAPPPPVAKVEPPKPLPPPPPPVRIVPPGPWARTEPHLPLPRTRPTPPPPVAKLETPKPVAPPPVAKVEPPKPPPPPVRIVPPGPWAKTEPHLPLPRSRPVPPPPVAKVEPPKPVAPPPVAKVETPKPPPPPPPPVRIVPPGPWAKTEPHLPLPRSRPAPPPPVAKVEPPEPPSPPPPPVRIVPPGPWAWTEPHLPLPRSRPAPPPPVAKVEPPKPVAPPPAAKVEPPKPPPPPPPPVRIVPPGPWAWTEPHLPLPRSRPAPPPSVAKVEPPKPVAPPPVVKMEPPKPVAPPPAAKVEPPKPVAQPPGAKVEPPKPPPPPAPAPPATQAEAPRLPAPADSAMDWPGAGEGLNLLRGPKGERRICMTFDGGSTAEVAVDILDVLHEHGIRTTLFLTGEFIRKYPDLVRRMAAEGHELGNHTLTHPHLAPRMKRDPQWTRERFQKELLDADRALYHLLGRPMDPYWRAPFGEHTAELRRWAEELGYRHVSWSEGADTLDWATIKERRIYHTGNAILDRLEKRMGKSDGDGLIVLMHLGSLRPAVDRPAKFLGPFMDRAIREGWHFVAVGEYLKAMGKQRWEPSRRVARINQGN